MSTFLQSSFNARSAENTSSVISPGNSTQTPLGAPNGSYTGAWVPSAFYSVLQITAKADSLIQILVEQSFLGVAADQVSDAFYNTQEDVNILRAAPFYAYITLPFMRIIVSNIDAIENTIFELATKLTSTPPPQNVHVIVDSGEITIVGPLPEGTNSIGYVRDTAYNTTAEAWQALQIDAGNLKVVETNSADIKTAVESLNTNVVLCDTDNVVIESGTISVDNFPAIQPISGSITVDNFPEIQLVAGENAEFTFYPTAANNTATIYADGTQGTNVAGGWKYTNLSTGKINWYLYASASPATDYKVSDLTSMYTVVNQQSSLGLAAAQNPWFMIYTRPDSNANSAGWYKSKLFFGSNAHTDILGLKLLYIGADPVAIHPEITGINRIQLQFNSALSNNKQLIDVQTESIMLGSLQTTNNTPAGQFNFTFTQYGIDWVQTPAVLPIEFGKVQVQDVAAEASLEAINAKITACNTGAVVISSGSVSISNFPATQPISGSVSISGTAQVQDLQLENIAGVLASKPVGSMIINNWYRVANAGNTPGAVWLEIGAYLNPGESAPRVGMLFKCLYVYGDTSPAAGHVWDEPYNTWESDNLVVVEQNLQVVEANSAGIVSVLNSVYMPRDTNLGELRCDIIDPLPEGANTIGSVNIRALYSGAYEPLRLDGAVNLKTVDKNSADNLTAVQNIEINANKTSIVTTITPQVYLAGNGLTVDMGTDKNRMRNAAVMVTVDTTTSASPSIMFGYSEDDIAYYFDGTLANFYDLGSNLKSAVLQRTAVPSRYIRVCFITDTEVEDGIISLQKS